MCNCGSTRPGDAKTGHARVSLGYAKRRLGSNFRVHRRRLRAIAAGWRISPRAGPGKAAVTARDRLSPNHPGCRCAFGPVTAQSRCAFLDTTRQAGTTARHRRSQEESTFLNRVIAQSPDLPWQTAWSTNSGLPESGAPPGSTRRYQGRHWTRWPGRISNRCPPSRPFLPAPNSASSETLMVHWASYGQCYCVDLTSSTPCSMCAIATPRCRGAGTSRSASSAVG